MGVSEDRNVGTARKEGRAGEDGATEEPRTRRQASFLQEFAQVRAVGRLFRCGAAANLAGQRIDQRREPEKRHNRKRTDDEKCSQHDTKRNEMYRECTSGMRTEYQGKHQQTV